MSKKLVPNIVRGGAAVPLGRNYYYMVGRKHKRGGIDIGKDLEVEGGEIVQMKPKEIRVFSAQPMLNGESPARKVLKGENPNKVFNQQESYKDRNKINDDGTKAKDGKKTNTKYNRSITLPSFYKYIPFLNKYANNFLDKFSDLSNEEIANRLYNNMYQGYDVNSPFKLKDRLEKTVLKNEKERNNVTNTFIPEIDALWAEYLNIPKDKRRPINFIHNIQDASYTPTKHSEYNIKYKKLNVLSTQDKENLINAANNAKHKYNFFTNENTYEPLKIGESTTSNVLANRGLGTHTISRGLDKNKGEYISYYDLWDMAPIGKSGEKDQSIGIGAPINLYDRIYLDDYYGINTVPNYGDYYGGYLPEITVIKKMGGKAKNGIEYKSITNPVIPNSQDNESIKWLANWLNNRRKQLYNNIIDTNTKVGYTYSKYNNKKDIRDDGFDVETTNYWNNPFLYLAGYNPKRIQINKAFYNQINNAASAPEIILNKDIPEYNYETKGVYVEPNYFNNSGHYIAYAGNPKKRTKIHERTHAMNALPQERKIEQIIENKYKDKYYDNSKEIYSRLMEFRYDNNLDPNKQITIDDLNNWKNKLKEFSLDRYDDNTLLQLFNDVAYNNNNTNKVKAKDGIKYIYDKVDKKNTPDFIRMRNPKRKSIQDWKNKNNIATNKVAVGTDENGQDFLYNEIQDINGELVDFTNPKINKGDKYMGQRSAIERNDTIHINSITDGLQFSNDYKNVYKGFKMGGLSRSKDYGSSKKPYPKVAKKDFAGGNRSYPIPTKADAIDALRLAGLHGRSDVKAKVYRKYPELKKKAIGGTYVLNNNGKSKLMMIPFTGDKNKSMTTRMASGGRKKAVAGTKYYTDENGQTYIVANNSLLSTTGTTTTGGDPLSQRLWRGFIDNTIGTGTFGLEPNITLDEVLWQDTDGNNYTYRDFLKDGGTPDMLEYNFTRGGYELPEVTPELQAKFASLPKLMKSISKIGKAFGKTGQRARAIKAIRTNRQNGNFTAQDFNSNADLFNVENFGINAANASQVANPPVTLADAATSRWNMAVARAKEAGKTVGNAIKSAGNKVANAAKSIRKNNNSNTTSSNVIDPNTTSEGMFENSLIQPYMNGNAYRPNAVQKIYNAANTQRGRYFGLGTLGAIGLGTGIDYMTDENGNTVVAPVQYVTPIGTSTQPAKQTITTPVATTVTTQPKTTINNQSKTTNQNNIPNTVNVSTIPTSSTNNTKSTNNTSTTTAATSTSTSSTTSNTIPTSISDRIAYANRNPEYFMPNGNRGNMLGNILNIRPRDIRSDLNNRMQRDLTVDAQNKLTNIFEQPSLRDNIRSYFKSPAMVSDAIGFGSNLLSGITGAIINKRMLNNMQAPSMPAMEIAPKLKTRINIQPQLAQMRESLANYERNVDINTGSSQVALARKQNARLNTLAGVNNLYGTKENMETELINQDKINRQQVAARNVERYNNWQDAVTNFENKRNEMRSENRIGVVNTLNQGLQNTLANIQQRASERRTIGAMMAANPNLPIEYFVRMGIITPEEAALYRRVNPIKTTV